MKLASLLCLAFASLAQANMVRRRLLATPPSVVAGSLSPAEGDVITIPAGQTTVDVTFTADCSAAGNQIMSVVYVLFDGNKKVMKVVPELPTDAVDDAHTFETATPSTRVKTGSGTTSALPSTSNLFARSMDLLSVRRPKKEKERCGGLEDWMHVPAYFQE